MYGASVSKSAGGSLHATRAFPPMLIGERSDDVALRAGRFTMQGGSEFLVAHSEEIGCRSNRTSVSGADGCGLRSSCSEC